METPKERHLVLEEYIVAYFGDYLTMLEKGVEHIVEKSIQEMKSSNQNHQTLNMSDGTKIINTQNHQTLNMSDGTRINDKM